MRKILLFLLFPIFSFAQVQIGQDIDAEEAFDFFGYTTSLSSDGNILAVGAPFNDDNGNNSGHVRVFENQGGSWVQIGEDIDGENQGDNNGRSVSLSGDGSILAIGAEKNDANGNNSGHVRVFENQGGSWVQIGENIFGEGSFDFFGSSVSLSADGSVLAAGAEFNEGNGEEAGHARVFENQGGSWVQIGEDIEGINAGDFFGKALNLSADGNRIAIGSGGNASSETVNGYVQVYENQNGTWVQVGEDIIGEAAGDVLLSSPSDHIVLSSDGNILAIGARHNDGNGESSGHVRIFADNGGSWVQVGTDIDGEAAGDQSGHSVSISADGSIIAIGARDNNGTGTDAGHVRVFDLNDVISSTTTPEATSFAIYPNPSSAQITIELEQVDIFEQATIYNNLGQQMITSSNNIINTSSLAQGSYIIEVRTKKGSTSQKLIIQ